MGTYATTGKAFEIEQPKPAAFTDLGLVDRQEIAQATVGGVQKYQLYGMMRYITIASSNNPGHPGIFGDTFFVGTRIHLEALNMNGIDTTLPISYTSGTLALTDT